MFTYLIQAESKDHSGGFSVHLRHFGAFGLFSLALLDSLPLPTFGGPDVLMAILSASHRDPWYEYASVATAGSVIGAFLTFRLARRVGLAYLDKNFGSGRVPAILKLFERWGTGALVVSTAVPLPFPTGVFYAAAGASTYPVRKYLIVVGLCRAVRYSLVAILAEHFGRHFIRAIRHPDQVWGWFLLFAALIACVVATGIALVKRLDAPVSDERIV